MKSDLVPQDVSMKHESEWQALRQAAENRVDIGRIERSDGCHINAPALKPARQQRLQAISSSPVSWRPLGFSTIR
jgi:hypothetical protein